MRSGCDLSPRRTGFDFRSVGVRFVVDSDTARELSPSTSVSPVSIIPPMLHIHLHLHVAVIRRTSGRRAGNFKQSNAVSGVGWGEGKI